MTSFKSNILALRRPPTASSWDRWSTAATDLKAFLSLFARALTWLDLPSSIGGKNRNLDMKGERRRMVRARFCNGTSRHRSHAYLDEAVNATAATPLAVDPLATKLFLPKASIKTTRLHLI